MTYAHMLLIQGTGNDRKLINGSPVTRLMSSAVGGYDTLKASTLTTALIFS